MNLGCPFRKSSADKDFNRNIGVLTVLFLFHFFLLIFHGGFVSYIVMIKTKPSFSN